MNKRFMFTVAGAVAVVLAAGVALGGVPCAGTSDVVATPDCGGYCPEGDLDIVMVKVTDLDCYGTPLPDKVVTIKPIIPVASYYCFCPEDTAKVCTTNVAAECSVYFQYFGGCGDKVDCELQFSAISDDVEIGPSNAIVTASPDSDGDCDVDLLDFIYFATQYLSDACCANYDCVGGVALLDFITFATHYLHSCP